MNKLIAVALIAIVSSTAVVGSASAFVPIIKFKPIFKFKINQNQEEVGVAFDARAAFADPKAECEAAGGHTLRKFNDEGVLELVCVL